MNRNTAIHRGILFGLAVMLTTCGRSETQEVPAPQPTLSRAVVIVSAAAPNGVKWAADDVRLYLTRMGLSANVEFGTPEPKCEPGTLSVVFVGDGLSGPGPRGEATDQTWRYHERECHHGGLVFLSGGGLLGRQYAAYEWLHAIGVRFFHPEEEYVPVRYPAESPLRARQHTPDFKYRSVSLHLTHPLELGDPIRLGNGDVDEVRRYIAWQVKNGASMGLRGVGKPNHPLHQYGVERGFPTVASFGLHNQQQGADGILAGSRDWRAVLQDEIDTRMVPQKDILSFTFNPSEFTEVDDREVVNQLTFISDYVSQNLPWHPAPHHQSRHKGGTYTALRGPILRSAPVRPQEPRVFVCIH